MGALEAVLRHAPRAGARGLTMGDSDQDKSALGDLTDLDWDSALDEWEKNTFVPEVARDTETNRVAAPVAEEDQTKIPAGTPAPRAAGPRPAAGSPAEASLKQASGEGTVIAPVPSELKD